MYKDPLIDDETLSEQTYEALRGLIREASYAPGTVLSESMLARQLDVGRTPVREAIVRLTHEGLLTRQPRGRGLVVHTLNLDDVRELYDAREVLEVVCARRAAQHATDDQLERLSQIIDQSHHATEFGISWTAYRKLDGEFHGLVAQGGGNKRIEAMLASMFDAAILDPWYLKILAIPGQTRRSVAEHTDIYEAIRARDPDRAEAAVRRHAQSYRQVVADRLFGTPPNA